MELRTKLTLYITLSKLAVVTLFVLALPFLVDRIAFQYNDFYLREQKKKVLEVIGKNGLEYYLAGEMDYGSYTMLKEEYISIEPAGLRAGGDTIATVRRVVENDTLTYRVLTHIFSDKDTPYILEVGKTAATIGQYNRPLQKMAIYVLAGLLFTTVLLDLIYTRVLLRPLGDIIRNQLLGRKFPFKDVVPPVKTTSGDFRYLDSSISGLMERVREAFDKEREFTANASHELMTPISILQHKIENLMLEEGMEEQTEARLVAMMNTVHRLRKIVQSLLLISRIENDQFPRDEEFALADLLEEVVEELRHRLEDKQLQLKMEVKGAMVINMNRDLIFQLFHNLVNNAIRYNRPGGDICIRDVRGKDGRYAIIVEDTGIGIPEHSISAIFERFRKLGAGEGLGLGLSIVATIAKYHDISLEVDSVEGKGSAFTVWFPLTGMKKATG
ncbi:HAMP domain-containing sensor histidine kinase [Chitinophaga caseinilytica]|uniref:histidine kinase n=1 Tax=Chitinophaga caseinilytica TaxID=2267521 RepID=A0ABZ2Z1J8_9BACT